jgi:hypothetical protein
MEEMIVLEVLEKSGKVRERARLCSFPVKIGRAYDNDVILDDEYVSPHHLQIVRDEQGMLRASDMNSENGLYQIPSLKRVESMQIATDNQLLLGATHIRIRRANFAVAPTARADRRRHSIQNTLARGRLFALLLLAAAGAMLMESYLGTFQKIKYSRLALDITTSMLVFLVWPAIWAFVGRLLGHRSVYFAHANILFLAMLSLYALGYLNDYYSFAFSAEAPAKLIEALAFTLVGGVLLYGHLHFATQLKHKTLAISSSLVVGCILGISMFSDYVSDIQFSSNLSYPTVLKPVSSIIGQPLSSEAFFSRAQTMKQELDKASQEDD